MQKPKTINLADSNIAKLGSKEEKDARKAAAMNEKQFEGAGKKVGIEIWRVKNEKNNFGVVKQDEKEHGIFYGGDSYIILKTYKKGEKMMYDLHFWLGAESSQDEVGTAAYKTVELDDVLGGAPVQYRQTQGYESPQFLKLFKKQFQCLKGGFATGFAHVKPTEYKPRLLHMKGTTEKSVRIQEVKLELASLNQGDSFVLDNGLMLYQWNGTGAGVFEKRRANECVALLKEQRNGKPKSEILDGDEKCEPFWKLLGGPGKIPDAVPDKQIKKTSIVKNPSLFQLSDADGKLTMTQVKAEKKSVTSDDVFLLDRHRSIALYIGSKASHAEKTRAFAYAVAYLKSEKMPKHTPICRYVEGQNGFFDFIGV